MTIKVEAEKVLRGLNNIFTSAPSDMERVLDEMASDTSVKMKSETPKGRTRMLSDKVEIEKKKLYRKIESLAPNFSGQKYAYHVEKGSGPAAGHGQYIPNVYNIQRYYGVDLSVAWAIAKSIQTKGNEPDPFVSRTFDYMKTKLDNYAKEFGGRIAMRFMTG